MIEALAEEEAGDRLGPGRTRTCAVTRNVGPEAELIRFVAAPDGTVVPDLRARLPGRGIWVGLERRLVSEAVRKNVFARGLKAAVKPAADLTDLVAARLREVALGRLGLARKAGAVAAGFAKVEAALTGHGPAALLMASDAAEDGRRKMEQALRRSSAGQGESRAIRLFSGEELSLALGLPNVIHAAVLQAPAGRSFVEAMRRLQRYEGVEEIASIGQLDGRMDDGAAEPQDVRE